MYTFKAILELTHLELECSKLTPDHIYNLDDLHVKVQEKQVASYIHGRLQHQVRHRGAELTGRGAVTLLCRGVTKLTLRKSMCETERKGKLLFSCEHNDQSRTQDKERLFLNGSARVESTGSCIVTWRWSFVHGKIKFENTLERTGLS